jgi:hypothetical protein
MANRSFPRLSSGSGLADYGVLFCPHPLRRPSFLGERHHRFAVSIDESLSKAGRPIRFDAFEASRRASTGRYVRELSKRNCRRLNQT